MTNMTKHFYDYCIENRINFTVQGESDKAAHWFEIGRKVGIATVPMKYRRMEHNAALQLRADKERELAMAAEAKCAALDNYWLGRMTAQAQRTKAVVDAARELDAYCPTTDTWDEKTQMRLWQNLSDALAALKEEDK